jgi:hypothetical protein
MPTKKYEHAQNPDKKEFYKKGVRNKDKEVDEELLYNLARLGVSKVDCARALKIRPEHLSREGKLQEIYEEGRDNIKVSLRRKQIELALDGSIPLLIFLGKNLLGQSDKVEEKTEGKVVFSWDD